MTMISTNNVTHNLWKQGQRDQPYAVDQGLTADARKIHGERNRLTLKA